LNRKELTVRDEAINSLGDFVFEYYTSDRALPEFKNYSETIILFYLNNMFGSEMTTRRGYPLALGSLHFPSFQSSLTQIINALVSGMEKYVFFFLFFSFFFFPFS